MATDFSNGALPALLPFLKDRFSLSYTAVGGGRTCVAGVLVADAAAVRSLVGPPRRDVAIARRRGRGREWGSRSLPMPRAFWLVLLLVLVSGLGSAAFHPEGSKFAGFVSGRKRASGMAWFSIGGNLGFAVGPIATTAIVVALDLRGGLILAVPGLLVAAALLVGAPYLRSFAPERGATRMRRG